MVRIDKQIVDIGYLGYKFIPKIAGYKYECEKSFIKIKEWIL